MIFLLNHLTHSLLLNELINRIYQKSFLKQINHIFTYQSVASILVLIYISDKLLSSAIQIQSTAIIFFALCVIQHLSDMTVHSDFSTLLLFTFRCHWNHHFHHILRYNKTHKSKPFRYDLCVVYTYIIYYAVYLLSDRGA